MIKRIIFFLLVIYPIIALLPRDSVLPNTIWGAVITVLLFFKLFRETMNSSSGLRINIFDKIGLTFLIIISISIMMSGDYNFYKWYGLLRIVLPVLIASFLYRNIEISYKLLKQIYRILLVYLILFNVFIAYRLSMISFNIFNVMANRETVWYEKPYGVALTYVTLVVLFFYISIKLNKLTFWQLVFILPGYFFGSRTVLIGITFFLLAIVLIKFRGFLGYIMLFIILGLSFVYLQYNNQSQDEVASGVTQLLLSERDALNESNEITQSSFSSGRNDIFSYYYDNLTPLKFFVGTGFEYYNVNTDYGFRLHNDVLEFFFTFGIFGILFFLYFIYGKLLIANIRQNYGKIRIFFIGFALFFISLSLLSSIMDYQNIIYLYLVIILNVKWNEKFINNNENNSYIIQ